MATEALILPTRYSLKTAAQLEAEHGLEVVTGEKCMRAPLTNEPKRARKLGDLVRQHYRDMGWMK